MERLDVMTEAEASEYTKLLATAVENILPAGPSARGRCLFAMLLFDGTGAARYLSNAQRPDVVAALRQAAEQLAAEDRPAGQ